MKYLPDIAKAVSEGVIKDDIRKKAQDKRTEIDNEIANLSDQDIKTFVELLLKNGIKFDGSFYNVLTDVCRYTGYRDSTNTLIAKIWVEVIRLLEEEKATKLLSSMLSKNNRGFWTAIHCLPTFSSLVELPSSFAATWFFELANRVAGDLAGGDFYIGISKYAEAFPKSALAIFEQYMSEQLNPIRIHVASIFLGIVRSKSIKGVLDRDAVRKWDNKLQKSKNINHRIVYHKSLISSFNLRTVSVAQLRKKLSKMLQGNDEEVTEAFNVVGRCLLKDKTDDKFIRFGLSWYAKNASPDIPDWAKYHLINFLWLLCSSNELKNKNRVISNANNLIIAIQPIPEEQQGTWGDLENYLVDVLHNSVDQFEKFLFNLMKANPQGILGLFRKSSYLKSELSRSSIEKITTKLLISSNIDEWEIGKTIFQDTRLDTLSKDLLEGANQVQLEMALLQFIRSPFLAEKTCKYLSQLEPYFRNTSTELQKTFKNELVVQGINYPHACLNAWKNMKTESSLMSEAIVRTEKYFEALSKLRDSPAVSFSFPECMAARQKADQVFRSRVMQEAKEKSVFVQFAQHLEIVYGNRWATFIAGRLDGPSSFSELSHSMEFPRLEVIDPEGMAIRRLTACSRIEELKNKVE